MCVVCGAHNAGTHWWGYVFCLRFSVVCCFLSFCLCACILYKCCHFWYSLRLRTTHTHCSFCYSFLFIHAFLLASHSLDVWIVPCIFGKTFNTCCHANNTCHSFNACNLVWLTLLHNTSHRCVHYYALACIVTPRMVNKIYEHHFRRLNLARIRTEILHVSDSVESNFSSRLSWTRWRAADSSSRVLSISSTYQHQNASRTTTTTQFMGEY